MVQEGQAVAAVNLRETAAKGKRERERKREQREMRGAEREGREK